MKNKFIIQNNKLRNINAMKRIIKIKLIHQIINFKIIIANYSNIIRKLKMINSYILINCNRKMNNYNIYQWKLINCNKSVITLNRIHNNTYKINNKNSRIRRISRINNYMQFVWT